MTDTKPDTRLSRLIAKGRRWWEYASEGVWADDRQLWWVKAIKTLNLAARSFLDRDLQTQACAMTYRTLLAVVPALALLFAIGRGFGFQNMLETELLSAFPAQRKAIVAALGFVDSYLKQASEGIFVGVGIVFLLWTLISLFGNIEDQFNHIWGVTEGRTLWRKITDYTAMLLILPILMICASGLQLMVSNTIRNLFDFDFITPFIDLAFEFASYAFTWLFFATVYMVLPNIRVKFKNAIVAGFMCGTGFQILQWLFVTGQIYVAKYNAIYGSFSFLPLLLIWMQLAWMVCLAGAVLCYALQNAVRYTLINNLADVALDYRERLAVAIMAVTVQRYKEHETAATAATFSLDYGMPSRVCSLIMAQLIEAGLISRIVIDVKKEEYAYAPAFDPESLTVAEVVQRVRSLGKKNFVPNFDANFPGVSQAISDLDADMSTGKGGAMLVSQLEINHT